ncbi:hypothetical protein ACP70R_022970 [Stipagrostis hirtigluma subsp. patula]
MAIEVPCFHGTTLISLDVRHLYMTLPPPPPAGQLAMLDSLCDLSWNHVPHANWNLMQKIGHLPSFSVLELYLEIYGHNFGAMVLNILEVCTNNIYEGLSWTFDNRGEMHVHQIVAVTN